jgi:hypothetical protein
MKSLPERELLVDLAKLFRKYGPEPFESLALRIASPESSAHLASLLRQSAGIARREGVNSATKKSGEVDRFLARLRESDPEKWGHLQQFAIDILSRTLPISNSELADAVKDLGERAASRDPRQKLALSLIQLLAKMPIGDIQSYLHRFVERSEKSPDRDRSLSAWADLIMRDAPK